MAARRKKQAKPKAGAKKEMQKQLFSPFPVAVTSRRRYRQQVHPIERLAGLLPKGRTKRPDWFPGKSKTIMVKNEVRKLLNQLESVHGVNTEVMAKTLLADQHLFFVGESKMLDAPRLAEHLEGKSVTKFRGVDYSQVPVKVNLVLMFVNNKRLSELIKGKKGRLPLSIRIEQTRQENHLKSIARGGEKAWNVRKKRT